MLLALVAWLVIINMMVFRSSYPQFWWLSVVVSDETLADTLQS